MKGVFVILDGVADDSCSRLDGKTPLECSRTPNLDFFTSNGSLNHCFPIAEGVAPQSSSGIVSLFGADFRDYPRGIIEAVGAGIALDKGDLVMRCNFSTIDNLRNMKLVDRRVGRTLTNNEALELAEAVNSKIRLPFKFELIPTVGHRAVLIFRGVFSANITNIDPSYDSGLSVENSNESIEFSKANDDSNKSKLTADLVNLFVKKSYVLLENHPVNIARKKKGFFPANFILCRDAGIGPVKVRNLPGKWMGLGYMPLEKGIINLFGMKLFSFNIPIMDKSDFYAHAEQVLSLALKKSIEMIENYKDVMDYFYIHFKETDLPGHDNKPLQKVRFIEMIDKDFFGYLKNSDLDYKMIVTADHTTSCKLKGHTSSPVPLLFYDSNFNKDENKRFTEKYSLKERPIMGRQVLSKTLFSK